MKKPVRYDDDSDMLVNCSNQNYVEENNVSYFRIGTRCSSCFRYQCCGIRQKNLNLLNDRNDNYWFCLDGVKLALNAIFMEKVINEKCHSCFSLLEPRIVDFEKQH